MYFLYLNTTRKYRWKFPPVINEIPGNVIRFERLIVRDSPSRTKRETSVAVHRGQENQVGYYDVTFVNLRKIPNGSLFGNGLVGVAVSTGTHRSILPLATNAEALMLVYTITLFICYVTERTSKAGTYQHNVTVHHLRKQEHGKLQNISIVWTCSNIRRTMHNLPS